MFLRSYREAWMAYDPCEFSASCLDGRLPESRVFGRTFESCVRDVAETFPAATKPRATAEEFASHAKRERWFGESFLNLSRISGRNGRVPAAQMAHRSLSLGRGSGTKCTTSHLHDISARALAITARYCRVRSSMMSKRPSLIVLASTNSPPTATAHAPAFRNSPAVSRLTPPVGIISI